MYASETGHSLCLALLVGGKAERIAEAKAAARMRSEGKKEEEVDAYLARAAYEAAAARKHPRPPAVAKPGAETQAEAERIEKYIRGMDLDINVKDIVSAARRGIEMHCL